MWHCVSRAKHAKIYSDFYRRFVLHKRSGMRWDFTDSILAFGGWVIFKWDFGGILEIFLKNYFRRKLLRVWIWALLTCHSKACGRRCSHKNRSNWRFSIDRSDKELNDTSLWSNQARLWAAKKWHQFRERIQWHRIKSGRIVDVSLLSEWNNLKVSISV